MLEFQVLHEMLQSSRALLYNSFKFRIRSLSSCSIRLQAPTLTSSSLKTYEPPSIRPDLFTSQNIPKQNYLLLDNETYPNPLFSMSKESISELSKAEFNHLIQIPYRDISETHQFCLNIIRLINEILMTDTAKAVYIYNSLQDNDMKLLIRDTLEHILEKDPIKSSLFAWMIDPTSRKSRGMFIKNVIHLSSQDKPKEERSLMILAYFAKLSELNIVNTYPFVLKSVFINMVDNFSKDQYRDLFSYLVHLNVRPNDDDRLNKIRVHLLEGSPLDKFVAMTGWVNPRWHHINKVDFPPTHMEKIINFFTINELKMSATHYINCLDILNSKMFTELLVAKFELKSSTIVKLGYQIEPRIIKREIQAIYDTILLHAIKFKGALSFIKVLKYFVENDLDVTVDTLIKVMKNLREQKYYKEALTIVNHFHLESLSSLEKQKLAEEILLLIDAKYPNSPKILLGYIATIYNNPELNDVLSILNDLGLMDLVYQQKISEPFDFLQKANVDAKLTGLKLTPEVFCKFYRVVLELSKPDHNELNVLYTAYKEVAKSPLNNGLFQGFNMNDEIVKYIIEYLLKSNPSVPTIEQNLVTNPAAFKFAAHIMDDFHEAFLSIPRKNRSRYLYDLLIMSSVHQHHDVDFASKMIRHSRRFGLPFTYHQVSPFIIHHYNRREHQAAKRWYDVLVKSGADMRARSSKEIYKIARELQWDVYGFAYRKLLIHKNHKARELSNELLLDPMSRLEDTKDPEDMITDELIDTDYQDTNVEDQILSLLDQLRKPVESDTD